MSHGARGYILPGLRLRPPGNERLEVGTPYKMVLISETIFWLSPFRRIEDGIQEKKKEAGIIQILRSLLFLLDGICLD